MDTTKVIALLEEEWEPEKGALWKLRNREIDKEGVERLINLLRSIDVKDAEVIDRRLVSLIWFMPLVMEWQKPHFQQSEQLIRILDKFINQIVNELFRILGSP
jgi:hypothetical protein